MCNTNDIPEESEDKSTDSESEDSYVNEGNEHHDLPPNLEPYLAQLNHLAQHDLNFQNLLLMYLVTTLPGFGGNGQADNLRTQTSNQIRDLLVDMISSTVKTQPDEEETTFPVPVQPMSDMEALGMFQTSPMVMGYPAADLHYRSPTMGVNNYSMGDRGFGNQPLYQYHGGWMPTHAGWNGGEQTIAGLMQSGVLQVQAGFNIREMKDEDIYGNGPTPINYGSDSLNNSHSNSSPASINDFTSEGFLSEGDSFEESSEAYSDSL